MDCCYGDQQINRWVDGETKAKTNRLMLKCVL